MSVKLHRTIFFRLFFFFFFGCTTCRMRAWLPKPEIEGGTLQWKHRVLTTVLPGKCQYFYDMQNFLNPPHYLENIIPKNPPTSLLLANQYKKLK